MRERDGDVGLNTESRVGGDVARDCAESRAKVGASGGVEVLGADPWRVADDEVEASGGGGVGEVGAEVEGDRSAVVEVAQCFAVLSEHLAYRCESAAVCGGQALSGAEECLCACRLQQIAAFALERMGEAARLVAAALRSAPQVA